jgi:hypothetical protein
MTRAAHTHARISLSHTHARCATLHTTRPSKKSVITFEEWQTEHYEMTIKTSRRGVQTWTFALVRSGNPAGMRRWEVGCGESGRQVARVQHWSCEGQGRMRPIRARLCARFGGVQGHKATAPSHHVPVPLIGALVEARCANLFSSMDPLPRAPLSCTPAIAHQDLSLTRSRSLPRPPSLSVHSRGGGGGCLGVTAPVQPACAHCVSASGLCFP